MCRSRRELSNAYLLAKIGVDTAENEPLEVWGENSIHYSLHSLSLTLLRVQALHNLFCCWELSDLRGVVGDIGIEACERYRPSRANALFRLHHTRLEPEFRQAMLIATKKN